VGSSPNLELLASDLRVVLGQLIRRLRVEHRFPLSQGSVLGRLDRGGLTSIGDLALAERVRPQSMTQTVADLEAQGLIARQTDPDDGRRILVALTDRGHETLEEDRRNREGWLASAIANDLSLDEQRLLEQALELLRRLAEG
jgi:DNA-binding MarR family transcriptional regulator